MSRIFQYVIVMVGLVSMAGLAPLEALALTPPQGFQIQTVASGLNKPVTMAFAPDGRVFIAEKDGVVRLIKNGALVQAPVITLQNINTAGDRGLLGLALDPNFTQNGYMYLAYTHENSPNDYWGRKTGRIVRVTVQGDTASNASMVILVGTVAGNESQPSCDNFPITSDCIPSDSLSHSVGGLRFGPDGKLYAALGDGAGFMDVDPRAYNAQNLDALTGKMLRINADGSAPTDNPFYTGNGQNNRSKVWFYGLRNSYKFNFRPGNGTMFFGEVGWKMYEEINIGKKGANYGWPCREGYEKQPEYNCDAQNYTNPIYVYGHESGTAAVTGGAFPTNNVYPDPYRSSYFFADVTGNVVKRMFLDANDNVTVVENFFDNAAGPVELLTGPDGYLYYLAIYTGQLRKITYAANGNNMPVAQISSNVDVGPAPLAVQFGSAGSSDADNDPLTFLWNFGDGQTSNVANPTHTFAADGTYTVSLTARDGRGGENTATKTIRVGTFATTGVKPEHVSSVSDPIPTYIGRDVMVTSKIKNTGAASPFIVDLEIYDKNNVQVAQKVFEGETIPQNGTKDYSLTWFPGDIGTYRLAVGLFHAGWTGLYSWTDAATTFTVLNRAPETPTTTPPVTSPFTPVYQTTTLSKPNPAAGENTLITTSVKNLGQLGSALIDIEVYKDGTKVGQKFYDLESFNHNETRDFTYSWNSTTPGTYKVSVGIFKPGWSDVYAWLSDVQTITVGGTTTPPPPPPPNPNPGTSIDIYTSGLGTGWENWSWDTTAEYGQEMKVTFSSPWAGLYLHKAPFTTTGLANLSFDVNGALGGNQKLRIIMYNQAGEAFYTTLLDSYLPGGVAPLNAWANVTIPLSALQSANTTLSGFVIQGTNGLTQAPFFLDNLKIQ